MVLLRSTYGIEWSTYKSIFSGSIKNTWKLVSADELWVVRSWDLAISAGDYVRLY